MKSRMNREVHVRICQSLAGMFRWATRLRGRLGNWPFYLESFLKIDFKIDQQQASKGNQMDYFIKGIKNYAVFSGRAGRKDYWMFFLIYFLLYVVLAIIDHFLGIRLLSSIFGLFMFIPSISYAARRLHDIGRTGWWQLITVIPLIGLIVLIVFLAQKGNDEDNQYGVVL